MLTPYKVAMPKYEVRSTKYEVRSTKYEVTNNIKFKFINNAINENRYCICSLLTG